MKTIRNKIGLIEVLKKFDPESSISETIEQLQNYIDEEKEKEKEFDKALIKKYSGQYLKCKVTKFFNEDKTAYDIVHIEDIKRESYDTDGNKTYAVKIIEAYSTSFFLSKKEYREGWVESEWSEHKFTNSEIITEEEFNKYRIAYNKVSDILNTL